MRTIYLIVLMVLLGAAPVFSQAKSPDNKTDYPFRYYKPNHYDSLSFFSYPKHLDPSKLSGKIYQDFKFNSRDLRLHSALPAYSGMPTFQPTVRDKMPVVMPDSMVKYHLRVKSITGGKTYK